MVRRSTAPSWVFPLLVLILVALPIAEIALLIQLGHMIGLGWTLLLLLAEAVFGAWLLRHEGTRAWKALVDAFGSGRMPTGELADAALVLVGGIMFILPGLVTDVIGLFCILPITRPVARSLIAVLVSHRMATSGVTMPTRRPGAGGSADVIEGEVVPDTTQRPTPGVPEVER